MRGRVVVAFATLLFMAVLGSVYYNAFTGNSKKLDRAGMYDVKAGENAEINSAAHKKEIEKLNLKLTKAQATQSELQIKLNEATASFQKLKTENSSLVANNTELEISIEKLNNKVTKLSKTTKAKKKKTYLKVNYYRPDKDYYGWGIHSTGRAVPTSTAWADPIDFKYIGEYGAYAKIELHDDHKEVPVVMTIHRGSEIDCDPDPETSGSGNSSKKELEFDASKQKEIWLISGIGRIFSSEAEAVNAMRDAESS